MSNARQAIAAAEQAGVVPSSDPLLAEAQALLTRAEEKLQRHNYNGARMDAMNARLKAAEALDRSQHPN